MVVAGDHANNDMAGDDEDSWKSQFEASGAFDKIDTQIAGLGEIDAIQQIYVDHTKATIESLGDSVNTSATAEVSDSSSLTDGTYSVAFNTDSGMFHVNEANNGRGVLTVKDGKMTIHISLVSKRSLIFCRNSDRSRQRMVRQYLNRQQIKLHTKMEQSKKFTGLMYL